MTQPADIPLDLLVTFERYEAAILANDIDVFEAAHGPSERGAKLRCAPMYIARHLMYNLTMTTVSVAEARQHLSDVIDRAGSEAVFIERRGRRAAVVVSPEQYERMVESLEEAEDAAAFDEAMAEEGPNVPWAQVKSDLGWG